MKKHILISAAVITSIFVYSKPEPNKLSAGIYGVCACAENQSGSPILLTINPDHTFTYLDKTNPNKVIDIKGTWETKGNRFHLNSIDNNTSFHRKWKFSNSEKCITAKYKMEWRRICLLKSCK